MQLVRVMGVDLSLQGQMSTVEFESRVEEGESARKTGELRVWSMEATEQKSFNEKQPTKSNVKEGRLQKDHCTWPVGHWRSVIEQFA